MRVIQVILTVSSSGSEETDAPADMDAAGGLMWPGLLLLVASLCVCAVSEGPIGESTQNGWIVGTRGGSCLRFLPRWGAVTSSRSGPSRHGRAPS